MSGDFSDLFVTLAQCRGVGLFAWFDAAGRQLPQPLTDDVPVLLDEDDPIPRGHGNHHHRTGMANRLKLDDASIGVGHGVDLDIEDAALVDDFCVSDVRRYFAHSLREG